MDNFVLKPKASMVY